MKKQIVIFITLFFATQTLFSQQNYGGWSTLKGSGKIITLSPDLPQIDKIEMDMNATMIVEIGKPQSVKVDIDDNLAQYLDFQTNTTAHKLTLKLKDLPKKAWVNNANITIRVSLPEMSVCTQKANGDITIKGLNGRYFRAENFGNGNFILKGATVDAVDLDMKGNGDIEAKELTAKQLKANLSGNGSMVFNASEQYEAVIYGNGSIENVGKGVKKRSEINGNGSIR